MHDAERWTGTTEPPHIGRYDARSLEASAPNRPVVSEIKSDDGSSESPVRGTRQLDHAPRPTHTARLGPEVVRWRMPG